MEVSLPDQWEEETPNQLFSVAILPHSYKDLGVDRVSSSSKAREGSPGSSCCRYLQILEFGDSEPAVLGYRFFKSGFTEELNHQSIGKVTGQILNVEGDESIRVAVPPPPPPLPLYPHPRPRLVHKFINK